MLYGERSYALLLEKLCFAIKERMHHFFIYIN